MNKHFTTIVLILAIAFIAAGSVYAVSLPTGSLTPDNGLTLLRGDNCGGLRADEYYACLASGRQPGEDAPVLAK